MLYEEMTSKGLKSKKLNQIKRYNSKRKENEDTFALYKEQMSEANKKIRESNSGRLVLPESQDYNNITNFFIEQLGMDSFANKLGTLLLSLSVVSIIMPMLPIDYDVFKSSNIDNFMGWFFSFVILIWYILSISLNTNFSIKRYHDKLTITQKKFLNESLIDELITYLRKGDDDIVKHMLSVVSLFIPLYKIYEKNNLFYENFYIIPYILASLVTATVSIRLMSRSTERTKFLSVLQHLKTKRNYHKA